jgi:hypothetical protein
LDGIIGAAQAQTNNRMKNGPSQPNNWKPTTKDKGQLWVGLGICAYVLALASYLSSSPPDITGRLGLLKRLFVHEFGATGLVILWILIGTAALYYGLTLLLQKE